MYATNYQLKLLAAEAGAVGDLEQVKICARALGGDEEARVLCALVLEDQGQQQKMHNQE